MFMVARQFPALRTATEQHSACDAGRPRQSSRYGAAAAPAAQRKGSGGLPRLRHRAPGPRW
eukprot:790563-Alexandrium_andersonii.AAC.1